MKAKLIRLRFMFIPTGSRRERIYHAFRVALLIWKQAGFRIFVERIPWWRTTYLQNSPVPGDTLEGSLSYKRWIKEHEPNYFQLLDQRRLVGELSYRPLITIITPVYNPEPHILRETIQSVLGQTYPHWELCLADGGSNRPGVKEVLDEFAQRDDRIKVKHLGKNLGIAGNSNEALRIARGEFISLLDHDDLLAPDMLFEVVRQLNRDPLTDLIYFDEDKVSADGKHRLAPWFKPAAWSPDLMLSTNYLMHSVIRRALVNEIGEFNQAMDGAQDWDLSLRLIEKTRRLAHIPRVFYHWRQVPGSAASDANAKPWAFEGQKRCIEAYLKSQGIKGAQVIFPSLGLIRIVWPVSGAKVSIIIPTKNKAGLLQACLSSILEKTTYPNFEIVLVDNGSTETDTLSYYETLAADSRIKILTDPSPFNYHRINNLGARQADGEILVFLNNDTEVLEAGWLEELAGWAQRPEVGIVGAKLLRQDGSIQHAGIIIGLAGHGSHVFEGAHENLYGPFGSTEWYRNYQAVTGACMAMRRQVFEELGGFDEAYQMGYGDIDICLRAVDKGYRVVYTPFARILHREGGSRGYSLPPGDVLRASVKMFGRVQTGDQFFSPNLSHLNRNPAIPTRKEQAREDMLLKILYDFDLLGREDEGGGLPERWRIHVGGDPNPALALKGIGKKVLLVTHELSRSGAPIILYEVARYLADRGFQITVLSPFDGPLFQNYTEAGMQVFVLPSILEDARVVLNYIDGHDLVFANTILAYRIIHAAKAFDKPCIWWIHESKFGQNLADSSPCAAQALNTAWAVLFPSQATSGLYRNFSTKQNYYPILSGIDVEPPDLHNCKMPYERDTAILKLVEIASIESRKGQDILLQSLKAISSELKGKIQCYLIGRILSKTERAYCKKIIKMAHKMKDVHILGDLPAETVKCFLESADVFVLPSRDEALPISLIEAMAFGKTVVATRVGGVPEVVKDGVNGILIENGDYQGLADRITTLYQDRAYLQRLGENARQTYLEKLTFPRMGEKIYQIIDSMGICTVSEQGKLTEQFESPPTL